MTGSRNFIALLLVATFGLAAAAENIVVPSHLTPPEDPVPADFFGMHIHHINAGTPWPSVRFGTWRLWDAGVSWPQLEPEQNVWNFHRLDSDVATAEEHGVEIILPLG